MTGKTPMALQPDGERDVAATEPGRDDREDTTSSVQRSVLWNLPLRSPVAMTGKTTICVIAPVLATTPLRSPVAMTGKTTPWLSHPVGMS